MMFRVFGIVGNSILLYNNMDYENEVMVLSFVDQLNEKQRAAATCVDAHVRIIAGAGSGKTRVVTTRIAYLIKELGILPDRIMAITFTNKAANEMKQRMEEMLEESVGIQISTIHSLCVRMLREDIAVLDYPRSFTILDSDDQKAILKRAYKEYGVDAKTYSYGSVIGYISANKTAFVSVEKAKDLAGSFQSEQIKAQLYAYYEKELAQMKALDFDDLLLFVYRILEKYPLIREKWQNRYDYIHVDEFQDVDRLQWGIIRHLVSDQCKLCVVGDPDQTIYTWRGADIDIIMRFDRDFPDCKTIVLNENYRSTPSILNGANAVIANNRNRIEKELFTRAKDQGKIVHFSAMDDANEPVWIAAKVRALHASGARYRDIAVLYRSNYLSRSLEKAMLDAQIPYRIYGGMRFYDRAEIKDALSYLRLCLDHAAIDLAVRRVINVPKRGVGDRSLEALEAYALSHGVNLYEAVKADAVVKGKARAALGQFVEAVEAARAKVHDVAISILLQELLLDSGYLHALEEANEQERIENIKELIADIEHYEEENPDGTLDDYMQMISLYTDKEETESNQDFIQLMSIHAAKGLEFDYVFVYSLSEGVFPNERSVADGGAAALEEERRLAYVAFTRAKKKLFISDAQGYSFVLDRLKKTSRFVAEIDPDCIEHVGLAKQETKRDGQEVGSSNAYIKANTWQNTQLESNSPAKRKAQLRKGDKVQHQAFGEGIIVRVDDGLATIAFAHKFGIRKIRIDHPSIKKIG